MPIALAVVIAIFAVTTVSVAQEPGDSTLTVSADFNTDRFIAPDTRVRLTLSRALRLGEGRLAVVIGAEEMTPLFEHFGTALVFRGRGFRLPAGENEVRVYLVAAGEWRELGRFPLRVLTRAGFEKASFDPGLTLNNKGQLAAGRSGAGAVPDRETYQDGTASFGLQTSHERNGWMLATQVNALGVTNEKEALRFGERGADAMRVDLADYAVRLERPGVRLAAGHVAFGQNRHLISGFASRGVTATVNRGVASLTLGVMNGSSIVGWDNIFGMKDRDHRVAAASLSFELLPKRPGGLHMDLSLLDGSLLPATGYSEGGVVDAETSSGLGVQIEASTPSQRLRASAGMTRSRFDNAPDPQLFGDTTIVPARAATKAARYVEASAGLLQDAKVAGGIKTTLGVTWRHERVDPLYRSVGAYTQADIDRNVFELAGNVGVVNIQFAHNRASDNLDDVISILTTSTRMSSGLISVPVAPLLRISRGLSFFPTLSLSRQETHQRGEGVPENSDFQASHVPDQLSIAEEASAQWQSQRLRVMVRLNRSRQDNRQPGREKADLEASANSFGIGVIVRTNLDLQVDASIERQENLEFSQVNRTRRIGISGNWRASSLMTIDAAITASRNRDAGASSTSDLTEGRLGISRGVRIWRTPDGGPAGQLFLRLARQSNTFSLTGDPLLRPPSQRGATWNITSGLSLRLF